MGLQDKVTPARPRVRRGNAEDAQRLRDELLAVALRLFAGGGVQALSMRAIAAELGVSAMTPYRYFADKAELQQGLWQFTMQQLYDALDRAVAERSGARARQRAWMQTYLGFWEAHPDHFWLVNLTPAPPRQRAAKVDHSREPVFARHLELLRRLTVELAAEIGTDLTWAKRSEDIVFAMLLGYLQALYVNRRYPWSDLGALRDAYIEQALCSKERCLRDGGGPAPGDAAAAAPRWDNRA